MKTLKAFVVAFSISLAPATLLASESKNYAEIGYIQINYEEPGFNFNHGMVGLRVGHNFTENFAVEGLLATNTGNATIYVGLTPVNVSVQSAVGLYLKASTTPSNNFSVYGRAGFTHGRIDAASPFGRAWASDTGPSVGVGFQFDIDKSAYLALDYTLYYMKNDVDIFGPSLNIGFRF